MRVHVRMSLPRLGRVLVLALLAVGSARVSAAANLTLAWDPSGDTAVTGFVLYYGTASRSYTQQVNVGATTSYTLSGLTVGTTYYFAVRAYNAAGVLSDFSEEVSGAPDPPPATTGCSTPDPFAAMGGGVCYAGGWWPPGSTPGSTPAPSPAPPSAPAPPPAATPSPTTPSATTASSCSTPDPFAPMGGGTCYNGGWLPPGMVVPSSSSGTPAPAPSSTPTVPSASPTPVSPPPSSIPCPTADPFAAIGGGTCYNGGWLPPGMSIPNVSSPLPAPPPSPSTPSTCTTPDPFVSLGGGKCVNGGWVPKSMGGGN